MLGELAGRERVGGVRGPDRSGRHRLVEGGDRVAVECQGERATHALVLEGLLEAHGRAALGADEREAEPARAPGAAALQRGVASQAGPLEALGGRERAQVERAALERGVERLLALGADDPHLVECGQAQQVVAGVREERDPAVVAALWDERPAPERDAERGRRARADGRRAAGAEQLEEQRERGAQAYREREPVHRLDRLDDVAEQELAGGGADREVARHLGGGDRLRVAVGVRVVAGVLAEAERDGERIGHLDRLGEVAVDRGAARVDGDQRGVGQVARQLRPPDDAQPQRPAGDPLRQRRRRREQRLHGRGRLGRLVVVAGAAREERSDQRARAEAKRITPAVCAGVLRAEAVGGPAPAIAVRGHGWTLARRAVSRGRRIVRRLRGARQRRAAGGRARGPRCASRGSGGYQTPSCMRTSSEAMVLGSHGGSQTRFTSTSSTPSICVSMW